MRYLTTLKKTQAASATPTEPRPAEIEPLGNGRYAVTLDGVRHDVDAYTLDHGAVSLIVDGRSYNVELDEQGDDILVLVKGEVNRVDVASERQLRLRVGQLSGGVTGKQWIQAPMPGKVVKVLVKAGDDVQEGQGLVVVEAMKMENELKSPKAGKVGEVAIQEGATVEINAKLVSVE